MIMRLGMAAALCCLCTLTFAAESAEASIRKNTNIPAEGLGTALQTLATTFDFQVLYRTEIVQDLKTKGASGSLTPNEALGQVLNGTGLSYKYLDERTVTVFADGPSPSSANSASVSPNASDGAGEGKKSNSGTFRLAQTGQGQASSDVSIKQANHPEQETSLGEIVVTAQKRESTVQKTPISLTAITGRDLQDRGITDISAIVQSVPGVSQRSSGPGQTELEIRGTSSAGGNSSTVGFYLGDIPLTAPANAQNGKVVIDPDLYDLNRVEILRGPQGTLYGSGSLGGTVKVVPNAPDPKAFDAAAETILGHTSGSDTLNNDENAFVNLPLSDTAAVRIVGTQEHLGGWIDRKVIAEPDFPAPINATTRGNVAAAPVAADYRDVNDEVLTSARIAGLWQATDRLSIAPSFLYQRITQDGLSLIDTPPGTNSTYQPFNSPEGFQDRIDISGLTVQYHFNFADLSSTTSFWTRDENVRQDGTESFVYALGGVPLYPSQGGLGPNFPTSLEDDKSQQYSEEVRLTSAGNTDLKWLVGYFYQDFESFYNQNVYTPFSQLPPPANISDAFNQIQPTKILQNSFFGEASYTFLEQFTATLGLRRYYYHGSVNTIDSGYLSAAGGAGNAYFSTSERDSGVTPKLNLSYQIDPELLVYTTAAQGFRPGGGNNPVPTSGSLGTTCLQELKTIGLSSVPLGFKPDKLWNYEIGEKFRNDGGRVTVNSAAYFENWQHIQQDIPLDCGFFFTGNAGAAHIYGAEIEVSTLITSGLVFSVSSSWLHAEFIANAVPATTIDDRVQEVPEFTASESLAYRHPIGGSLSFISRIDNNYIGSRIDTTAQANYLPPYDLTNIRAGVEGDHWKAELFVNNVTNRLALISNAPAINVEIPTFNRTAVQQPITFGIELSYHFGGK